MLKLFEAGWHRNELGKSWFKQENSFERSRKFNGIEQAGPEVVGSLRGWQIGHLTRAPAEPPDACFSRTVISLT